MKESNEWSKEMTQVVTDPKKSGCPDGRAMWCRVLQGYVEENREGVTEERKVCRKNR